jgi:PAS domain S-box-containing protein
VHHDLRIIQCWPLWVRLALVGVALGAAYLLQIPLERDWPGEPFLLFLLIVIGTTLCFGARLGLISVALSAFLSLYFFEPIGSPTLRYASDLEKILLYTVVALGCVVGFAYVANALIAKTDANESKSVLLRELAHGVANNFAAIAALIHTAREAVSPNDSKAKSVLDDAIEQIKVMARVHRRLRAGSRDVSVDSKAFILELCKDLKASMARDRPIEIECKADSRPLCIDDAVSLGLIINELVTNATKHAFPHQRIGRIRVALQVFSDQTCLSVEDDGVGFDDRHDAGMGEDLVKGLSHQLGGDLRVKSSKTGSTFRLSIPHQRPDFVPHQSVAIGGAAQDRVGAQPNVILAAANKTWSADFNGLCREAIGALPAAVYMTDAMGRITFYNEAAAALWGCRPELGDSKFCGSWKLYWPDGTPLPHDQCPMAMALHQKKPIRGIEAVAERPDGTRITFIPYPTPLFDNTGRLSGAVNMLVDISERKRGEQALAEREAQLAVFIEHAPAAIAMFDREMRYLAVSRRFVVDYQLPPGAQLIGRSHYEVFPNVPQRWRDIHARVLAGEELSQGEDQYTRHDGRTDWVRWSMVPWRGANGNIGGALLFAEIITEQVEGRPRLRKARRGSVRRSRMRRWASRSWVTTDQFCASTTASLVCLVIPPKNSGRRPSGTLHTRMILKAISRC